MRGDAPSSPKEGQEGGEKWRGEGGQARGVGGWGAGAREGVSEVRREGGRD